MKVMTKLKTVLATLPAEDIERAKQFYGERLGFQKVDERPEGVIYQAGSGHLFVYPSPYAGSNAATAASFAVDDVRETVDGLRSQGIQFEQFDLPNTSWDNGIAVMRSDGNELRGAWFRDSESNIIALSEFPVG